MFKNWKRKKWIEKTFCHSMKEPSCLSCKFHRGGLCRRNCPNPNGWNKVEIHDWCGEYKRRRIWKW